MDEEKQNLENENTEQGSMSTPPGEPDEQQNADQNVSDAAGEKSDDSLEMPDMKFNESDPGAESAPEEAQQAEADQSENDQSQTDPTAVSEENAQDEAEMLKMMEEEVQTSSNSTTDSGKPIVEKMAFEHLNDDGVSDPKNLNILLDVSLPLAIELGRTTMAIENILNLGPGSVVELDKLAGEPVDILVNDKLLAKGEVVVIDENFGVRITSMISPAERIRSLA